jgi:hypothetical protein
MKRFPLLLTLHSFIGVNGLYCLAFWNRFCAKLIGLQFDCPS